MLSGAKMDNRWWSHLERASGRVPEAGGGRHDVASLYRSLGICMQKVKRGVFCKINRMLWDVLSEGNNSETEDVAAFDIYRACRMEHPVQ
jgi:hypothetical protein